jgi:hypothetical protein
VIHFFKSLSVRYSYTIEIIAKNREKKGTFHLFAKPEARVTSRSATEIQKAFHNLERKKGR